MSVKRYLKRFQEETIRQGPLGAASLALRIVFRNAFMTNKARWYRLHLDGLETHSETEASVTFGFMTFEEAISFFRENHKSFPWMYIKEEMDVARESGHLFPCLRDNGEIAGYIKLGTGKVFILDFGRVLCIPSTALFIYDTFIAPSHRGKGLASFLIKKTSQSARENEFRTVWCHIPSWNTPSVRAFGKAGFEPIGEIRFARILGKEIFCTRREKLPFLIGAATTNHGELFLREALVK